MAEYINIEQDDLEKILENHKHYINRDCENWESMRADLSYTNLYGADLEGIDLSFANLSSANLFEACLSDTNLSFANLSSAILDGSDLRNAILYKANLRYANLSFANLFEANLEDAYLERANLSDADLESANLRYAKLEGANLFGANLEDANLRHANLESANLSKATISDQSKIKGEILTEDIIGYKKCRDNAIVTLKIPRGAIVFSINGRKCRANKAIVLDIEDINGNKVDRAFSTYKYMSYYVGDEITDYTFDCQYNIECSGGIHFFKTKAEAEIFKFISNLISSFIKEKEEPDNESES